MSTEILRSAYSLGVDLWLEGQSLKYKAASGSLSLEFLETIRENKLSLVNVLYQNETMKKAGWTTYYFGESYSKTIRRNSSLFMFREPDNLFSAWRGTWREGVSVPISDKDVISNVPFTEAFKKAESYFSFVRK